MALAWITDSLPVAYIDKAYVCNLAAHGGTRPYTYSLVSGSLLTGLVLGASSITGTPTTDSEVGVRSITLRVTDAAAATADAVFNLVTYIGNTSNTRDYKFDPTLEQFGKYFDHTNASHMIMAKLFFFGLSNSYDELLSAVATVVEGWQGTSPTHAAVDTNLATVLEELRTWKNIVGYPEFFTVVGSAVGPGPAQRTVTVSSANSDITVGTAPASYHENFLCVDANYSPYITTSNGVMVVVSATPGVITDGATNTVDIVLENTDGSLPIQPTYIVYGKANDNRDWPVVGVTNLFRIIRQAISELATQGMQQLNSVHPNSDGVLYVTTSGGTVFEHNPSSVLGINAASDGMHNGNLQRTTNIVGDGIESTRSGYSDRVVAIRPSHYTQMDDIDSVRRERDLISQVGSADGLKIIDNNLKNRLWDSKTTTMSSSVSNLAINDRVYRGVMGPAITDLPQCRGDSDYSASLRLLNSGADVRSVNVRFNHLQQKSFIGRIPADKTPAWAAEDWARCLEEAFTSGYYHTNVISADELDATKALAWIGPYDDADDYQLQLIQYSAGTTWTPGTVTVLDSYTGGGGGGWSGAVGTITVDYYNDRGAIAGGLVTTTVGSVYEINAGITIANAVAFKALLVPGFNIVVMYDVTSATYGIPLLLLVNTDPTVSITNLLINNTDEKLLSGVGYLDGDKPVDFEFDVDGYRVGGTNSDGEFNTLLEYPVELTSLVHGNMFLPSTTTFDGGTPANATFAFRTNAVRLQELNGSSGTISGTAASDLLNVWYPGLKAIALASTNAAVLLNDSDDALGACVQPICGRSATGNMFSIITGKHQTDELTECFTNEQYRVTPSLHPITRPVRPIYTVVTDSNLYGWDSAAILVDGHAEVGTFANTLVGTSYASAGLATVYDGTAYVPCLRVPRTDYTTSRAGYTGTNQDYSVFVATEYVYQRAFVLRGAYTSLTTIRIYGFDITTGAAIVAADITNGDIICEVVVPNANTTGWLDCNTYGTLGTVTYRATNVGVEFTNVGLNGESTATSNHTLMFRITITNASAKLTDYHITGIELIP